MCLRGRGVCEITLRYSDCCAMCVRGCTGVCLRLRGGCEITLRYSNCCAGRCVHVCVGEGEGTATKALEIRRPPSEQGSGDQSSLFLIESYQ